MNIEELENLYTGQQQVINNSSNPHQVVEQMVSSYRNGIITLRALYTNLEQLRLNGAILDYAHRGAYNDIFVRHVNNMELSYYL